ncbi:hypothetical protein THAOC_27742, partial [Thalassiosira oceanica]
MQNPLLLPLELQPLLLRLADHPQPQWLRQDLVDLPLEVLVPWPLARVPPRVRERYLVPLLVHDARLPAHVPLEGQLDVLTPARELLEGVAPFVPRQDARRLPLPEEAEVLGPLELTVEQDQRPRADHGLYPLEVVELVGGGEDQARHVVPRRHRRLLYVQPAAVRLAHDLRRAVVPRRPVHDAREYLPDDLLGVGVLLREAARPGVDVLGLGLPGEGDEVVDVEAGGGGTRRLRRRRRRPGRSSPGCSPRRGASAPPASRGYQRIRRPEQQQWQGQEDEVSSHGPSGCNEQMQNRSWSSATPPFGATQTQSEGSSEKDRSQSRRRSEGRVPDEADRLPPPPGTAAE